MANLGPLYQNQTYSNLLQVDGGLTSELKPVLDGDGNASGLTLSLTSVGIPSLVAASASNLNAGLAGTVPYQVAPNITGFTTVGTSGYALVSNGSSAPSWSNTIQNSTYASLAVDVSGGTAGQVLYQSDANNTSFTGVGTLGQVLVSGGSAAPYWSTSVPAAGTAGSATNLTGGSAGNVPYQSGSGSTQFIATGSAGQLLRSQGSAAPVWATLTASDVGALPLNGSTAMTGNLSMGNNTITNLLNPLASTDAATKGYVDSVATGLKIKAACRVASTANLVLSGLIAVDGVTVSSGDRVLVKDQSFQDQNGIYVASATAWTRATDADTWEELVGATCFITSGSTQANTTWASNIAGGGTIGVTPVTFVLFGSSASYTAGTGLTLVGSQFALATPVSVANGGSGATTLTGIIKGNGASAFTAATGADVVSLIGATSVQNATTAGSCSGNALTATTLQTARTINGVSFNGSANITVTANTTGSLNVVSNGLGDAAPFSFNGSATRDLSWNSIGAAAASGSNATGTWPISVTGSAANVSGIVGTANGGTGYASYATGDLLYASAPTVLSKLPIVSSDFILRSNGTVPAWGKVELNTTVVTGTLPTTRGGTGLSAPFGTLGAVYADTATTMTTGPLPVIYGGTGASTAPTARSNLGLGNIATINTTGSTTNFLRADGAWAAPASGGSGWTLSGSNTYTDSLILQGVTVPVTNSVFQYCSAQFFGQTGNVGGNIGVMQYSDDASCAFIAFGKSRSTTKGPFYGKTLDGDDLGETRYLGTTGTTYSTGGFTTTIVENRDTSSKICMTYNIWTTSRSYGFAQINSADVTDGHFVVNPSDFAPQRNVPVSGPDVVISFVNPDSGRFMVGTKAVPTFTMAASAHPGYFIRRTPCHVATTANITLSGLQTVDGVTLKINEIVLVKNQTTQSQNGIYRAQTGAWTRYNESNGTGNFTIWSGFYTGGKYARFHIYYGTVNGLKDFSFNGATSGTVGSTAITFAEADRWDFGPDTNHDFLATYWDGSAFAGQKIQRAAPAAGWVNYSDARVKTIVSEIDDAIAKTSQLRSIIGYMNNDAKQVKMPMLIAQDVQSVLPEAVFEDHDEDKTLLLSYQSVIPLLVAAIKELSAKVAALENNNG